MLLIFHRLKTKLKTYLFKTYILQIKDLLTECEVCTGKYLPEVFVQTKRRKREVCAKIPKANTFPHRPSKRG